MNLIDGRVAAGLSMMLVGALFVSSVDAQSVVLTDLSNFSGSEDLIEFEGLGVQGDPVPVVDMVSTSSRNIIGPPRMEPASR